MTDIIVSNPPYINVDEYTRLSREILDYEPADALTDQADGLKFYRRILGLIEEGIGCKFMLLELSGTQTDNILDLAHSSGFKKIKIIHDLNKIPRILEISAD
jgi:release factor glutamine methyltransferase